MVDIKYVGRLLRIWIPISVSLWLFVLILGWLSGHVIGLRKALDYFVIAITVGLLSASGGGLTGDDKSYEIFRGCSKWRAFSLGIALRVLVVMLAGIAIYALN